MLKIFPFTSGISAIQRTSLTFALLIIAAAPSSNAQLVPSTPTIPEFKAVLTLPDSPGAIRAVSSSARPADSAPADEPHGAALAISSTTDKYILPNQAVPSITTANKIAMGFKDAFSPLALAGWLSSAGYSQLIDSSPNYGTDRGAYGQRLGASVLRASSEGILSDAVMAPIFREDPRYYQLGRGHSIGHRLIYAATRTIITRTDSGHTSPNFALITGNLEGAILTNAYYPSRNRTVKDTGETFAGSIGGSALGFVVSEFLSDTLEFVHLKSSR